MGAPAGNQNAARAKVWSAAVMRALERRSTDKRQQIDALAEALIDKGLEGDMGALKEIGDRLEGKPAQSVTLAGDDEKPLVTEVRWTIVRPKS